MRIIRHAGLGALAAAAVVATLAAAEPDAPVPGAAVDDIPPGPLADALFALADAADVNIAFDADEVSGLYTAGARRAASLEDALGMLLSGTGLAFELTPSGDVSVVAAAPGEHPLATVVGEARAPEPERDTITIVGYRDALSRAEARARRFEGLVDVVSGDAIGRLPDSNIADALDRLPAVYRITDQGEGRYISVRGVGQVLNTVTLNGTTIAASDTDGRSGRAAPLDVLSASSIAEVEVHKVITPDRDSYGVGGLINVRTPSAHDFGGRVATLTGEVGAGDFGVDREAYAVRGAYANLIGPRETVGLYVGGEYWMREYLSHLYENPDVAPPDAGTEGYYPEQVRFGSAAGRRDRVSLTASLDWRAPEGHAAWARLLATDYIDEETRPEFTLRRRGDLTATGPDTFAWEGMRVDNETRVERQERPVRQYVLGARRAFGDDWTLDLEVNRTTAEELNPLLAYYETHGATEDAAAAFRIDADGVAVPQGPLVTADGLSIYDAAYHRVWRLRRVTSEVREEVWTQRADLQRRGALFDRDATVSFGVKRTRRRKSVNDVDQRFLFLGDLGLEDDALGVPLSSIGWGEPYAVVPGVEAPIPDAAGFEALYSAHPELFALDVADSVENSVEDDYLIRETLIAGYAMATVRATPALELTLGARVERTDVSAEANAFIEEMTATGFDAAADPFAALPFSVYDVLTVSDDQQYTTVSPAALVKWDRGGAWELRASLTRTFARPDYVDLAPISSLSVFATRDAETGDETLSAVNSIGNPRLRPIGSWNWDASGRFRLPGDVGWLSAAAFYKSIDGVAYRVVEDQSDVSFAGATFDAYRRVSPQNAGDGYVAGVELSARYDFLAAPAPFDGFGVLANASFIDSHIAAPTRLDAQPLLNQADAVYMVQAYYEGDKLQARLAYGRQNAALVDAHRVDPADDIYRAAQSRLDAKVIYDIDDAWRVTLSGFNLTDAADRTIRVAGPVTIAENPGYETYGREVRLGLTRRW